MTVTSIFTALLILGLGMLVRGLVTLSTSRATWLVRSAAGTARVTGCRPVRKYEGSGFNTFTISVEYTDARGQVHRAELPASQRFQAGDPVDIRFDPQHPATVYLSEHFAGWGLPMALIALGGALLLVSIMSLAN